MGLSKEWTDHKDPRDKDDFVRYIQNSSALLDRLATMLRKRIREINSQMDNDDFTSPAWAMQQAFLQGRRKALNEILKLLDRGNDD